MGQAGCRHMLRRLPLLIFKGTSVRKRKSHIWCFVWQNQFTSPPPHYPVMLLIGMCTHPAFNLSVRRWINLLKWPFNFFLCVCMTQTVKPLSVSHGDRDYNNGGWDTVLRLWKVLLTWNFHVEEIFASFAVDQKHTFIIPPTCFPLLGLFYNVTKNLQKIPPAKSSK